MIDLSFGTLRDALVAARNIQTGAALYVFLEGETWCLCSWAKMMSPEHREPSVFIKIAAEAEYAKLDAFIEKGDGK